MIDKDKIIQDVMAQFESEYKPAAKSVSVATYDPATGEMQLTIGEHDLQIGHQIKIAKESLKFTCELDGNATTTAYPRGTGSAASPSGEDYVYDKKTPITAKSATTISCNVGKSSNTSAHTFVNAVAGCITQVGFHTEIEHSKCVRDTGFNLDAIISDLLEGGIRNVLNVAKRYWHGTKTNLGAGEQNFAIEVNNLLEQRLHQENLNKTKVSFLINVINQIVKYGFEGEVYSTFSMPRHVVEFDRSKPIIEKKVIDDILKRCYEIIPSKNNIVGWQVHVLGPEHQKYKDIIFRESAKNDTRSNKGSDIPDVGAIKEEQGIPRKQVMYKHMTSCQYLLIMTQRLANLASEYQKDAWGRGIFYDPCTEEGLVESREAIALECGFFAYAFRGLAIEKGIDTSFTGNFSRSPDVWKELPFVDRRVNLLISVGYGKVYRRAILPITYDYKPSPEDIIKWV